MDSIIELTANRIFTDNRDNPDALWAALADNGLTKAWVPESMGGAGLSMLDGFGLIRISGSAAQSVPFTETLLASYLLSCAGLQTPEGKITLAVPLDIADSSPARCATTELPFGGETEYFVAINDPGTLSLYQTTEAERIDSIGTDPLYRVAADLTPETSSVLPDWLTTKVFYQTGALARSAQMCGAMDAILEMTLEHTSTREQFGRPLAKFQAIQHLLAEIAGEAAASSAIVDAAIESTGHHHAPDFRTIASAKSRTGEAAGGVAANAHQAHGAIGYTQEYALSAYTRRLWRWREEFGNETQWSIALGRDYLRSGSTLTEEFFQR